LLVGQNVPFATGSQPARRRAQRTHLPPSSARTSGTSLTIKAQINRGDSITLDSKQSTESIAPSVDVASDIVTNKRLIKTKALIKDGRHWWLAGCCEMTNPEQRPRCRSGDIPLLGKLFGSTSKSHGKTNLMVFIHPTILMTICRWPRSPASATTSCAGSRRARETHHALLRETERRADFETITWAGVRATQRNQSSRAPIRATAASRRASMAVSASARGAHQVRLRSI
jgi:Flp pilus assembly secretin CpaC